MQNPRKKLSTDALLKTAYNTFKEIKTNQIKGNRQNPITLSDCLMSGLAIFGLKYSSLLQFDKDSRKELINHNLKTLYKIKQVPSDTYMRERLDEINPIDLRKSFKAIFAEIQRGKLLEEYTYLDGYYLVTIDGTGFFSSSAIRCDNCCIKNHRNGTTTYYHQMFSGALVHPNQKAVIPFAPEAIMKFDGNLKNDCEFNAAKRFIADLRREHPHLKIIITGDSLHSKTPNIKLIQSFNMRFILGAKPGDHKFLFEFVKDICTEFEQKTKDGHIHRFKYVNKVPLNSNYEVEVNFLEYFEFNDKGKQIAHFSWVTDIEINNKNVYKIMKGGRSRWKIENETFNTLKNQGYNFEHNFGHGNKYLSTVFAMLMMLAFFIDQIQEIANCLFQKALIAEGRKLYLWNKLRNFFFNFRISSWEIVWKAMIHGHKAHDLALDTS